MTEELIGEMEESNILYINLKVRTKMSAKYSNAANTSKGRPISNYCFSNCDEHKTLIGIPLIRVEDFFFIQKK